MQMLLCITTLSTSNLTITCILQTQRDCDNTLHTIISFQTYLNLMSPQTHVNISLKHIAYQMLLLLQTSLFEFFVHVQQ